MGVGRGWGVREVVQMYIGAALAVTRGCLAHHIHWTLKKCNDPSCLSGGKKNASSDLCLVFFMNLICLRLNCHVLSL